MKIVRSHRHTWRVFTWALTTAAVLAVLAVPGAPAASAQDGATGSVSGTVVDEDGLPVEDVCVSAQVPVEWGHSWVAGTSTGADGTYLMVDVPVGEVHINFEVCGGGAFVSQWYPASADFVSSSPLAVLPDAEVEGIDAVMVLGIGVSGTVRDAGGEPIGDIDVWVDGGGDRAGAWARTGPDGRYTTSGLVPGSYRVEFRDGGPDPYWARSFWGGSSNYDDADVLVLTDADRPERTGIDVVLEPGATVSGRVTAPGGAPLEGVCIGVIGGEGDDLYGVGWSATGLDGSYAVGGLPPVEVRVRFEYCDDDAVYLAQWFDGVTSMSSATVLALEPASTVDGVDAELTAAGVVAGVVTDGSGAPLEGICVQVASDTRFGGSDRSGPDGTYQVPVSASGSYRVQYVDCSGAAHRGTYFGGGADPSSGSWVDVQLGETTVMPTVELEPSAPGVVEIAARTVDGRAVTTGCAVVYLPDDYVRFEPIGPDGTAQFEDVPPGTYATAVVGCVGEGDAEVSVEDPDHPTYHYPAMWAGGAPLEIPDYDGPDPFAQGAQLVTVLGGAGRDVDFCFGCGALDIAGTSVGETTVELAVDLVEGHGVDAMGPPVEFTARCARGSVGATADSLVVSAGTPTLLLEGLAPATSYECDVSATLSDDVVARSTTIEVMTRPAAVAPVVDPPRTPPVGSTTPAPPGSTDRGGAGTQFQGDPLPVTAPSGAAPLPAAAGGALALTGLDPLAFLLLASLLVATGVVVTLLGARRRRHV